MIRVETKHKYYNKKKINDLSFKNCSITYKIKVQQLASNWADSNSILDINNLINKFFCAISFRNIIEGGVKLIEDMLVKSASCLWRSEMIIEPSKRPIFERFGKD